MKSGDDAVAHQPLDAVIDCGRCTSGRIAEVSQRKPIILLQKRNQLPIDFIERVPHQTIPTQGNPGRVYTRPGDQYLILPCAANVI